MQLGLLGAACLVAFCRAQLARDVPADLPVGVVGGAAWHPGAPGGHPSEPPWGVALIIAGAVVGLGVGAVIKLPAESELGSTFVNDIDVGDCFGIPGATATPTPGQNEEVFGVDVVPCEVPHMYELIDVVFHEAKSDAEFPGADALFEYGTRPRLEHFEEISGTPVPRSPSWTLVVLTPNAQGWGVGDSVPSTASQCASTSAARADRRRERAVTGQRSLRWRSRIVTAPRWIASLASSTRREPPAASWMPNLS